MDTALTILGAVGSVYLIMMLCVGAWYVRRLNKLTSASSEELKAIVADPSKQQYTLRAIDELKSRGEDISFARPAIACMMSSPNRGTRFFGDLAARADFPDLVERFAYSWRCPNEQVTEWLQSVAAQDSRTT